MAVGLTREHRYGYWHPARVKARLEMAEQILRTARKNYPGIGVRLQPVIRTYPGHKSMFRCLRGESFLFDVDEPCDVWDSWNDLKRFLRAWRPWRRRTAAGEAAARQALDLWEQASRALKP